MKEKLLRSLNASDLSHEEWESASHMVAALGASQVNDRQVSAGVMLLHIKAGQNRFLPDLLGILTAHVRHRAKRERWGGVTPERAGKIAQEALDRFLHPLCTVCNGVGRVGELGQVIVLCSKADGGCGGTGKRSANYRGWMERVADVLDMLARWEDMAWVRQEYKARGYVVRDR